MSLKTSAMPLIQLLLHEMDREAGITRKMLSRVPDDHFDWKPHPKSMSVRQLTTHIAELPAWVSMTLNTSELDFAKEAYTPTPVSNTAGLLALHEKSNAEGRARLETASEDELWEPWTLRSGDAVLFEASKEETIRMAFSQTIHHRAQLGVFLRLLDIPIPGSYGPSADED